MSDVYVMLDQLKAILNIEDNKIKGIMASKVKRQVDRINKQIELGRLERK